ncbi:hypothetical protein BC834DRAFT_912731 [Gloeopeniophorella convolvens]|nr:hypothetical protein BC834DRAFT_912731 [Gloeopeniophorella convolvens]
MSVTCSMNSAPSIRITIRVLSTVTMFVRLASHHVQAAITCSQGHYHTDISRLRIQGNHPIHANLGKEAQEHPMLARRS